MHRYRIPQAVFCTAVALLLAGCDSLSADSLASRCDEIYEDLDSELVKAIDDFEDGDSADDVVEKYTRRIEKIAKDVPSLRDDLAKGGEKHRWQWPDLVRSETILRYEQRMNIGTLLWDPNRLDESAEAVAAELEAAKYLPDELGMLAGVERKTFQDLKWFCNRVVAAGLPPIDLSGETSLVVSFMRREMAAKELEIMRATQTMEELSAFEEYLRSVGARRR